jgi:RNA polymerase sigma-70 factor (ECF subfamily)
MREPSELEREVRAHLDAGDTRRAVGLVVERLGPQIRGYLRTLLIEVDAQEAFSIFEESVLQALPRFRWECSLVAWAHQLAYHAAARIWRDPQRRREEPLPSVLSMLGPGPLQSEPGASGRHEGLARLRAALSIEEQTLLVLRVDRELEWEEIAEVLGPGPEDDDEPPLPPGGGGGARPVSRRAAALRKRFERLKARLRGEALKNGLIE